ncbi:MAG: YraN family protein [Burkholderiaceae bacterium]
MVSPTRAIGDIAEDQALAVLRAAGLTLIDRNIASPLGEIDLLMRDGVEWVFIEVRSRASNQFGGAAASVTRSKQNKLRKQSQAVLKARFGDGAWPPCRFDVCAFEGGRINWIKAAF